MRNKVHKRAGLVSLFAVCCALLLVVQPSADVFGQENPLLNTSAVEARLRRQFKLTGSDIKQLQPLIRRENEDAVLMYKLYIRAAGDDFLSLWNGVRTSRAEFEQRLRGDLTPRQKDALRAARSDFETQILNWWLDDHVDALADFLGFDSFQVNCVRGVFEIETQKRLRLINSRAQLFTQGEWEWQKLTDEREKNLEEILDSDQLRLYHSMAKMIERLIA